MVVGICSSTKPEVARSGRPLPASYLLNILTENFVLNSIGHWLFYCKDHLITKQNRKFTNTVFSVTDSVNVIIEFHVALFNLRGVSEFFFME